MADFHLCLKALSDHECEAIPTCPKGRREDWCYVMNLYSSLPHISRTRSSVCHPSLSPTCSSGIPVGRGWQLALFLEAAQHAPPHIAWDSQSVARSVESTVGPPLTPYPDSLNHGPHLPALGRERGLDKPVASHQQLDPREGGCGGPGFGLRNSVSRQTLGSSLPHVAQRGFSTCSWACWANRRLSSAI